jgi:Spy/CpxP family protein refolding chaperone
MRTRLILSFTLALGSAMFATPTAWADGGFRYGNTSALSHHGRGPVSASGHMLRHLLAHQNEIGLSDEQITKLRTIALDADRAFIRASADRLVSERELRAMVRDAQVQMPAIEAKVKEAESFEATVRIIGIRAKRDLLAVLTPEQRAKLKTLRHGHRQYDRRPAQAEPSRQSELQDTELAPAG